MKLQIDLDWDDITRDELTRRITFITKFFWVFRIEIYLSSHSGYHILVFPYNPIPTEKYFRYRRTFKDDGYRLVEDYLFRRDEDHSCVLFERKTENGIVFKEEKLFSIERKMRGFNCWSTSPI